MEDLFANCNLCNKPIYELCSLVCQYFVEWLDAAISDLGLCTFKFCIGGITPRGIISLHDFSIIFGLVSILYHDNVLSHKILFSLNNHVLLLDMTDWRLDLWGGFC